MKTLTSRQRTLAPAARILSPSTQRDHVAKSVRGRRSHRLRISYRTTQRILYWAVGLLTGERFDDIDGRGHPARLPLQLHGSSPATQGYSTPSEELDALAAAIREWLDARVPAEHVGVAARTGETVCSSETAARTAARCAAVLANRGAALP